MSLKRPSHSMRCFLSRPRSWSWATLSICPPDTSCLRSHPWPGGLVPSQCRNVAPEPQTYIHHMCSPGAGEPEPRNSVPSPWPLSSSSSAQSHSLLPSSSCSCLSHYPHPDKLLFVFSLHFLGIGKKSRLSFKLPISFLAFLGPVIVPTPYPISFLDFPRPVPSHFYGCHPGLYCACI